jgi:hypothetical protein
MDLMKNINAYDDDIPICPELGIDCDLKILLDKEVSLLILQFYHHWRRGSDMADIARYFGVSEAGADYAIRKVQQLLLPETLAKDIDLRNEVLNVKLRSVKIRQRFKDSLTKSVDSYLAEGKDPIAALREFREFVTAESSDLIPELQERIGNIRDTGNKGFNPEKESPSIPTLRHEETKADSQFIKALPEENVALNIKEEDEIRAANEGSKKMREELAADLSLPVDVLLKRGINPAQVVNRYREAVREDFGVIEDLRAKDDAEEPNRITELRERNRQASINEDAVDLAARDSQLIAELREKDEKPVMNIMTEKQWERREPRLNLPSTNRPIKMTPNRKREGKTKGKRLTIRLDDSLYEKVQRHCIEAGIDLSFLLRSAIVQHLDSASASKDAANVGMPAEALTRTGKYQVAGSDLKEQLRENFLQLLAAAHVTARRWHREEWVHRLYAGLLPLYQHLEVESVRQQQK